MRQTRTILAVTLVALVAGSCTRAPETGPSASPVRSSASPSPSPTGSQTTAVIYYLLRSEGRTYLARERHSIFDTAPGIAPLEEIVSGSPNDPDLSSPWPRDAKVLSLTVEDGTAVVDWSAEVLEADATTLEEQMGIQQAVWTLTEVQGIERVEFRVEGKSSGVASNGRTIEDWWGSTGLANQPFSRGDSDLLEPITIWSPVERSSVTGRVRVEGDASVFEAHVGLRLRDQNGRIVRDTFTTASEGAPGRGTWAKTLSIPAGNAGESWTIEAVDVSSEDGSDAFVQTRAIEIAG